MLFSPATETRAKNYKRGLRRESYAAKTEALFYLDVALRLWGDEKGFAWGWKRDPRQQFHNQVLYVDVPAFGQCSFHAEKAASGQRYQGEWNSRVSSLEVVLGYCDSLATVPVRDALAADDLMPFGKHVGKRLGELPDRFWYWMADWEGISVWRCLHGYIHTQTGRSI